MKRKLYLSLFLIVSGFLANAQFNQYNIVWNTQSQNSSESMPCGGGDIGLNVWVENGDVLFYIAKSNVNSPDVKLVSHSDGKATLRLGSGAYSSTNSKCTSKQTPVNTTFTGVFLFVSGKYKIYPSD